MPEVEKCITCGLDPAVTTEHECARCDSGDRPAQPVCPVPTPEVKPQAA